MWNKQYLLPLDMLIYAHVSEVPTELQNQLLILLLLQYCASSSAVLHLFLLPDEWLQRSLITT